MTTVLIVDDEFGIVEALEDLLTDEGYRVVSASNGKAGLALLEAEHPDLAIVDVMMPIVDGLEMVRRLRALPEHRTLPVILMSAAPKPAALRGDDGTFAVEAFLRKPFMLRELLDAVRRAAPPAA